jgi:hypothetical protein
MSDYQKRPTRDKRDIHIGVCGRDVGAVLLQAR